MCVCVVVWYGSVMGHCSESSVRRHQPSRHPVHQLLLHQRFVTTHTHTNVLSSLCFRKPHTHLQSVISWKPVSESMQAVECIGVNLELVCVSGKTGLEKEQEFISKCMESLMMASANLEKDPHSSLTIIERGLLMLKTHLEAFRRRYIHTHTVEREE